MSTNPIQQEGSLRDHVGLVVIGRNEGERLIRCFNAVIDVVRTIVYVDSASSDRSIEVAKSKGIHVVTLDMSTLFTAARARNEGFRRLQSLGNFEYVQFVDGDCEMATGWMERAIAEFQSQHKLAIVCGRLCERFPESSIYNRLSNIEWDIPAGDVDECGGIFMIRSSVFERVGGFDPKIIAGEEPELCTRIRQKGWTIRRLPDSMAWHDADMHRFAQWFRRNTRNGHAFAEISAITKAASRQHWKRQVLSNWFWGCAYPVTLLALAWPTHCISLIGVAAYPWQIYRVARRLRSRDYTLSESLLYGFAVVTGKFPNMVGQSIYWINRLLNRRTRIIEYKAATSSATANHEEDAS